MLKRTLLVTAGALLSAPATSVAEPAVGLLRGGDAMVYFDTDQPAKALSTLPITGLATAPERLVSLDYRYHSAEGATAPGLFGLSVDTAGTSIRLYRIDSGTGAATPVGAAVAVAVGGQRFGIDFNPTADRVRVVNENDENLRLNPNNGVLAGDDPNLTAAGVSVTGVAYDRVDTAPVAPPVPANSTAYAIDNTAGTLGTIGGLNQSPSPNGGVFTAIGPLGVTPDAGTQTDFDISRGTDESTPIEPRPAKPVAVATITSGGVQRLYSVDLGTGAATAVAATPAPLAGIAVMPTQYASFGGTARPVGHNLFGPRVNEGDTFRATVTRAEDLASTLPASWVTSQGLTGTFQFEPGEASKELEIPTLRHGADAPDADGFVRIHPTTAPFKRAFDQLFTLVDLDPTPAPAPADVAKPTIAFGKLPKSVTYKQLTTKRGLEVVVTPNEPASITASLVATVRSTFRKKPLSVTVVESTLPVAGGARTVSLKPTSKELRRPKSTLRLRLRVTAVDAEGNTRTETRTLKVKPR